MENKWYHGRVTVLVMLFFVLGPLGLPLLWKSPHFSKPWKQILTVLTLIYTVLMLRVVVSAVTTSLRILPSVGL